MRVNVCGEVGEGVERLRLGPCELTRSRQWDDSARLVRLLGAAGAQASAVHPLSGSAPAPDLWLLSDVPREVLVTSGLHRCITQQVAAGAAVLMLGGCWSFGGAQGTAGWWDDQLLPVTCQGDDTVEEPLGVQAVGVDGTDLPAPSWPVFGYNAVHARDGSIVHATINNQPALITSASGRNLAWTSDLLPHWGPNTVFESDVVDWLAQVLSSLEVAAA